MAKKKPVVGIVMGSDSDWPLVEKAVQTLAEFGVPCEARVISAHRTPVLASQYAESAQKRGLKVIMSAAGGAAHLGGVLAAHTTLPVIGIPISGGALKGVDSLLATIQMPSGIPVPTVTLGSAGPVNAAIFAVQILALSSKSLAAKMKAHKRKLKTKVSKGNRRVAKAMAEMGL